MTRTTRKLFLSVVIWMGVMVVYVWVARGVGKSAWMAEMISSWKQRDAGALALALYIALLIASQLLPLSSTALLVFSGLSVFGPTNTFLCAYIAGAIAASVSYGIGMEARWLIDKGKFGAKLEEAHRYLLERRRGIWLTVFLARATPNPLYDVWGYAAGLVRVPFAAYLGASALGGGVLLGVACFLPGLVA